MTKALPRTSTNVEKTIARLEQELAKAMADCNGDACSKFLGEDFSAISGVEGEQLQISLSADWLSSIAARSTKRFTVEDTAISVHGGIAVATMLWLEEGILRSTRLLITDIWKSSPSGEWKLVERHSGRPSPQTG